MPTDTATSMACAFAFRASLGRRATCVPAMDTLHVGLNAHLTQTATVTGAAWEMAGVHATTDTLETPATCVRLMCLGLDAMRSACGTRHARPTAGARPAEHASALRASAGGLAAPATCRCTGLCARAMSACGTRRAVETGAAWPTEAANAMMAMSALGAASAQMGSLGIHARRSACGAQPATGTAAAWQTVGASATLALLATRVTSVWMACTGRVALLGAR